MGDFKVHKVFTQSGKSLAVVIPWEFAKKLGLIDGSYVRIIEGDDRLVIEPLESVNPKGEA